MQKKSKLVHLIDRSADIFAPDIFAWPIFATDIFSPDIFASNPNFFDSAFFLE